MTTPAPINSPLKAQVFVEQLSGPTGMALGNQGELYIANYSKNSIIKVDNNGQRSVVLKGGELHGPIGLARDPQNGSLYVANYLKGTVLRVEAQGKSTILVENLNKPYNLLLDNQKRTLYITEQGKNAVTKVQL